VSQPLPAHVIAASDLNRAILADLIGYVRDHMAYCPCIHPSTRDAVLRLASALKPPPPLQQWEIPSSFPDADQPY